MAQPVSATFVDYWEIMAQMWVPLPSGLRAQGMLGLGDAKKRLRLFSSSARAWEIQKNAPGSVDDDSALS